MVFSTKRLHLIYLCRTCNISKSGGTIVLLLFLFFFIVGGKGGGCIWYLWLILFPNLTLSFLINDFWFNLGGYVRPAMPKAMPGLVLSWPTLTGPPVDDFDVALLEHFTE